MALPLYYAWVRRDDIMQSANNFAQEYKEKGSVSAVVDARLEQFEADVNEKLSEVPDDIQSGVVWVGETAGKGFGAFAGAGVSQAGKEVLDTVGYTPLIVLGSIGVFVLIFSLKHA